MPQVHGYKVSGRYTAAFSTIHPSGLCPGSRLQWMPSPSHPLGCSSPRPSLLSTRLGASLPPTFHVIWKFQLGQRFCLFLFVSLVRLIYVFFHPRCSSAGPKATCSSPPIIRFFSNQHLVPSIHPGRQLGKTCLISATNDDCTGTCLLNLPPDSHIYASLRCVYIFPFEKSRSDALFQLFTTRSWCEPGYTGVLKIEPVIDSSYRWWIPFCSCSWTTARSI